MLTDWNPFTVSSFLAALSSTGFGILVFIKSKNRLLGRKWFLFALCVAAWGVGGIFFSTTHSAARAMFWWHVAYAFGVLWIAPCFYDFVSVFVEKELVGRKLHYGIAFAFLCLLPTHLFFSRVRWLFDSFYYAYVGLLYPFFFVWWAGLVVSAHVVLVRSYRDVSVKKQQQIKYFMAATMIGFTGGFHSYFPDFGIDVYPWGNFAICLYPVIMSYAILRHQLMDTRLVIRRTVVYTLATAVLTALYLFIAGVVMGWTRPLFGPGLLFSSAVSAFLIAVVFYPLVQKIQTAVDKLFSRHRVDREKLLVRFATDLSAGNDVRSLVEATVHLCQVVFRPKTLQIYVYGEHRFSDPLTGKAMSSEEAEGFKNVALTNFSKKETAGTLVLPITGTTELLGFILIGERASEQGYGEDDDRLLHIVASQLANALDKLRQVAEATDGIMHEIKTPLTNISLPAQLTLVELEDVRSGLLSIDQVIPKIQRRMKIIIDQVELASRRVQAVGQLAAGNKPGENRIRLEELLQRCLQQVQPMAEQASVAVQLAAPSDAFVTGDRGQLELAICNLLKNSFEALSSHNANLPRVVAVRGENAGDIISVTVEDNGPGIDAAIRERLFASGITTKGALGAGLGLYLSRQIVRAHGGDIRLRNVAGPGACFEIIFPKGTP